MLPWSLYQLLKSLMPQQKILKIKVAQAVQILKPSTQKFTDLSRKYIKAAVEGSDLNLKKQASLLWYYKALKYNKGRKITTKCSYFYANFLKLDRFAIVNYLLIIPGSKRYETIKLLAGYN
jgi:hypothetical protein